MALTKVSYSMVSGAPLNVLDYGAIGDGVDDTTAFLSAATAASAAGKDLILPAGTYAIGQVSLSSNLRLIGEPGTIIKRIGDYGLTFGLASNVSNITIENIEFDNNAPGTSGTHKYCIYLSDVTDLVIRNCKFYNGYDISIKAAGPDGVYISSPDPTVRNNILIENCTFDGFTRNGISATNGVNDITIRGCTFTNCGLFGVDFESDFGDKVYVYDALIDGCKFIDNGDYAIRAEAVTTGGLNFTNIAGATAYHSKNVTVTNCYFKTTTATNANGIKYFAINATNNFILTDCTFDTPDTASSHKVVLEESALGSIDGLASNNVFNVRIECYQFENIKITNNSFSSSLAYIYGGALGQNKTICQNTFYNCGDASNPVIVGQSLNLTIQGNVISDNRLTDAPTEVIRVDSDSAGTGLLTVNAVVADNVVYSSQNQFGAFINVSGGSSAYGISGLKVNGNTVTGATLGVQIAADGARPNSYKIEIENNKFSSIASYAVNLYRVTVAKVSNNMFYDCATNSDVIKLDYCTNYIVSNNIVDDSRTLTSRAAYAILAANSPSASALLIGNLSLNTQSGFSIAVGEGTTANNVTY